MGVLGVVTVLALFGRLAVSGAGLLVGSVASGAKLLWVYSLPVRLYALLGDLK